MIQGQRVDIFLGQDSKGMLLVLLVESILLLVGFMDRDGEKGIVRLVVVYWVLVDVLICLSNEIIFGKVFVIGVII